MGSRETNLTNEVGDGGHGHGVFQLDDRSHDIPAGFDSSVDTQALKAAAMPAANIASFQGDLHCGVSAYNCGAGNVSKGVARFRDAPIPPPEILVTGVLDVPLWLTADANLVFGRRQGRAAHTRNLHRVARACRQKVSRAFTLPPTQDTSRLRT